MDNVEQWFGARDFIYSLLALFYRGEVQAGLDMENSENTAEIMNIQCSF